MFLDAGTQEMSSTYTFKTYMTAVLHTCSIWLHNDAVAGNLLTKSNTKVPTMEGPR